MGDFGILFFDFLSSFFNFTNNFISSYEGWIIILLLLIFLDLEFIKKNIK